MNNEYSSHISLKNGDNKTMKIPDTRSIKLIFISFLKKDNIDNFKTLNYY